MLDLFDKKKIDTIKEVLLSRGETVSVAESVTSGFLQAALASATDASKFFQGGITAYNLGQKYRHLAVEPIHAEGCNCVSAQVAQEMAINSCKLFQSDWGIGITGYAAPVPESENKLFAYYAICHSDEVVKAGKLDAYKDDALIIELFYVNEVLDALSNAIVPNREKRA